MRAHTGRSCSERLVSYIMTQLDDARQMREAMPYEIEYLKVCVCSQTMFVGLS